jgi:hypothetical protein
MLANIGSRGEVSGEEKRRMYPYLIDRLYIFHHARTHHTKMADWLDRELMVDSSKCRGEGPTAASLNRSKIASFCGHSFGSRIASFYGRREYHLSIF